MGRHAGVPAGRATDAGTGAVRMLGLLAVQIVVALVTALSRTETADGRAGSSLALGVLVPMFGLGLNGLWAAYHGHVPAIPNIAVPEPEPAAEPDRRTPRAYPRARRSESRRRADGPSDRPECDPWLRPQPRSSPSMRRRSTCWDIAVDIEHYPEWAHDIKDVMITRPTTRDGRPRSSSGHRRSGAARTTRSATTTAQAPKLLAWTMVKGDIQRSIDGVFTFEPDRRRRHGRALRPRRSSSSCRCPVS